jgi:integrase
MARHTTVAIYRRDRDGKYHKCDLRGVYPRNDTTFVLRYEAERDRRVWEKLPAGTDYSAARRMALEKELALSAVKLPGAKAPASKPAPVPGRTRIKEAIDAYIDALWSEGNLDPKTIKGKKFELDRWAGWCAKEHVEELDRADLIAFRDRLRKVGKAEWTVESNMMTVVTALKHNPLGPVTGLLKPADWPEIEDTEPEPYEVEEVKALQSVATEEERLLIRFFVGTGCRDMEVAHLEWSDFSWAEKTVWIHAKPHLNNWKPKTRAGTRKIPISDSLVRDLKARRGEGLVFPAPRGGVDHHYLRTMQKLG